MADKFEATFHQGRPLPQRDPFETLASFDRGARPAPVDRMHYESPGRPPWISPEADLESSNWPLYLVALLAGTAFIGVVSAFVWWIAT